MRSLLRASLIAAAFVVAGRVCVAQTGSQLPTTTTPTRSTGRPTLPSIDGNDGTGDNPLAVIQAAQRVKSIAAERQRKIVEDAGKVQQLATELKDAAAKEKVSAEMIRKAEDIEKLARDVKQRTKG